MDTTKLAKTTVVCENASGKRRAIDLKTFKILREALAFSRVITRKKDGAVTRCFLKAEPDEIGTRITAGAEVVQIGASTWIHTRNLGLMGERLRP